MRIEPFRKDDIEHFLGLAAAENWMAESWEFEFLLSAFPQGCFAFRSGTGEAAGFVTSLCHDRSSWIGNLIVAEEYRGKGIGERLFGCALDSLLAAGIETVWLTASKPGLPLYKKFGFNCVDTIIRWNGSGRQSHVALEAEKKCNNSVSLLNDVDKRGWGDRRAALMGITTSRGKLLQQDSGFIVVQPCGAAQQIGPYSAFDDDTAAELMQAALDTIPHGTKVYLDVPASNLSALRLFNRKRMRISGSTELMCAGIKPAYRPEYIYGLATMGSCG